MSVIRFERKRGAKMTKSSLKWIWSIVFATITTSFLVTASQAAESKTLLILNAVGDILKVDLDTGKVLGKTYIPEAYYSNRILADSKGRYILVGGGDQLALFLDPNSLQIKGVLKPEIPKLPWEERNEEFYRVRLSSIPWVYVGQWAITPNGDKIYFNGEVPQLKPTVVIDPFTYEIKKKIKEFVIYPDTIFSADGKVMLINHRKTKEILIIDTQTDQTIKRIKPLSEQDGFHTKLLYFNSVTKALLVPYFSGSKAEWSLVWVDTNSGKISRIMNKPFAGKHGVDAVSSGGFYFVYNEYVSVSLGPNTDRNDYTGKVKIVDLRTMSRQTLSLLERYQPKDWNLASKCYTVPAQEKILLVIKKIVDVNNPGPTYWNPKLRHRKLLQHVHLLVVDLRRATIEKRIVLSEGGFKDCAFIPRESENRDE